jgi:hypothetical protein
MANILDRSRKREDRKGEIYKDYWDNVHGEQRKKMSRSQRLFAANATESRVQRLQDEQDELKRQANKEFDNIVEQTGGARMTPAHVEALRRALPGVNIEAGTDIESLGWYRPSLGRLGFYDIPAALKVPSPNTRNLPVMFHEYTHAIDPAVNIGAPELNPATRDGKWGSYEHELPAMASEKAVEMSPYRDQPVQPGTPYEQQIQKFGPQLTGQIDRDLAHVRNWTHALRGIPHTQLRTRNPYAYNPSKVSPQQRAANLHKAYQRWLQKQIGQ